MSRRKDRERAESGLIWRDGKLWRKEEWYALHPTKDMLKARQAAVDDAVQAELAKKTSEEKPYECSKCGRTHKPGSKIYEAHK